jgi:hypothetical protein
MLRATVCEKIIIDFEKMTCGEKTTPYCCDAQVAKFFKSSLAVARRLACVSARFSASFPLGLGIT